jgi:ABC-type transport system substrate-binding protein
MARFTSRKENHDQLGFFAPNDPPRAAEKQDGHAFAAARHNDLIEIAPDGNLVPEIAESRESADGKTWVFRTRQSQVSSFKCNG